MSTNSSGGYGIAGSSALYNQLMQQYQSAMLGGFGSSTLLGALSPPPLPQEMPGETLLVAGDYIVKRQSSDAVTLWRGSTKANVVVARWGAIPPSRSVIAACIRWDRQLRPRTNAKDAFGALLGVRFFAFSEDFHLRSPVQSTIWDCNILTAPHWDESEAVRGTCGIHAAWPPRAFVGLPSIDVKRPDGGVVARVRGLGKYVSGAEGWRAEKCIVDQVYLPSALWSRWRVVRRLEKLYPQIEFEEESWTLEKSLRSAKSSRVACR